MRIVFDTNVILSAFLTEGLSNRIFEHCIVHDKIFISDYIISALDRILIRKFKVEIKDKNLFFKYIDTYFYKIKPRNKVPDICRDADDNNILQIAEFTDADYIITDDKDLLSLKRYGKTEIISPREYYTKIINEKL